MNFEPMRVMRPREQVEGQLRSAIISRKFEQGTRLPSEAELATMFGVSRTTIREALRTLASDGLVQKVPGAAGGSFVSAIDHTSLSQQIGDGVATVLRIGSLTPAEIFQVRRLLEVPTVGLAAENRTEAQLESLRECVDEVASLNAGDPRIRALDIKFHSIIAESSDNRLLSAIVSALMKAVGMLDLLNLDEADEHSKVDYHHKIIEAIANKDANQAMDMMWKHMDELASIEVQPMFHDGTPFTESA